MVIVEKSLDAMLVEVEKGKLVRLDYLVPAEIPGCPRKKFWKGRAVWKGYDFEHGCIPDNYDLWAGFMIAQYDQRAEILEKIAEKLGIDSGPRLFGLALENAFVHGNDNNPSLPIIVTVFEGAQGVVIRVKDSGSGFNYEEITQKAQRVIAKYKWVDAERIPPEEKYFLRRGKGFECYIQQPAEVSFEARGAAVNIMYSSKIPHYCKRPD